MTYSFPRLDLIIFGFLLNCVFVVSFLCCIRYTFEKREKSSIIVSTYLFWLGVIVCMGPQTSVCTISRMGRVLFFDSFGKDLRDIFPVVQHSHIYLCPQSFILMPVARPFLSKSLIALGFRCPKRLCHTC